VDGRPRLVEGLAMPREQDEFALSYYNTMTHVDRHRLGAGCVSAGQGELADPEKVANGIRNLAARMPTYINS